MIESFQRNEIDYENWLRENRNGYVFNYCHTPSLNKLHHASCTFLHRTKDAGVRTTFEKICSTNYEELQAKIHELCGTGWSLCGSCFR